MALSVSSPSFPYYIYCPDYREDSAGVRVLHRLCDALNSMGYEAYVTAAVVDPRLNTPILTSDVEAQHRLSGRIPVTVYPEVTAGNPRQAPIVARYLLNRPGLLAGDGAFPEDEVLFAYLPEIVPSTMHAHTLCIPVCDTKLFNTINADDANRKGACFFAHRYIKQGGLLDAVPPDTLEVSYRQPRSLAQLAEIFRHTEVLYSYEMSILCWEAMLCGCPVVYLPNAYMQSQPYKEMFGGHGASWGTGPEDVALAKATVQQVYPAYLALDQIFRQQLKRFVSITQAAAVAYANSRVLRLAGASPGLETRVPVVHVLPQVGIDQADFRRWQLDHQWNEAARALARAAAVGLKMPSLHLAVIVPPGREAELGRTLASLMAQVTGAWQLTAIASTALAAGADTHPRLNWLVAAPSLDKVNHVLSEPGHAWVGMIEAGDLLAEHALFAILRLTDRHPEWGMIYSDEDGIDSSGQLAMPYFKPDYSPELMRSAPYALGGLLLLKREHFVALGGFRPEMEGVEYYDLTLRASETLGAKGIGHAAEILYHRYVEGGRCCRPAEVVARAREDALASHLRRAGADAELEEGLLPGTFRIRYRLNRPGLVSIIIPTCNGGNYLQRCIGALIENTDYKHWEVIVVDMASDDPGTLVFLEQLRTVGGDQAKVISMARGSSVPALLNRGAEAATGDHLLFFAEACAPLKGDWLEEMLGYASQPGVGVVGARLVAPDGTLSHAGYLLGYQGMPAALHSIHVPMHDPGYFGRLHLPHNPSAIAAACMLVAKPLFERIGGFDSGALASAYSDVDFCLRVTDAGLSVVWTPHATLLHEHTDGQEKQIGVDEADTSRRKRHLASPQADVIYGRWLRHTAFDPTYNRNLSLTNQAFDIETIPALTLDPAWRPLPLILAHPADRTGCGEYRIIAPMRSLNAAGAIQGYETRSYFAVPELARMSPDSIVFQRQLLWEQITLMEEYLRHSKSFRIYELDDLLTNVQLKNVAREGFHTSDLIKRFRRALSLCNRLVVSTDYLAEEYQHYIDDVLVVPNYLERARWGGLIPVRNQSDKPRVGWAGSITHGGDLELIIDVVKATRDEVDWVFFGMCPADLRDLVKEYHAGVPLDQYPAKLASLNLDLTIAPLEDVPFNHGKSHLRLLEFGILGYPVICTDITPYRGAYPVIRVRNRYKEWLDAIREHVSDRDDLARRGDVLREHIQANWMLEDHLDVWLKAWQQ